MKIEKLHDQLSRYKIEVYSLSDQDGGGFVAEIPKLGAIGDGDSPEEAIKDVKEVAIEFLKILQEDNKKLPEADIYKSAEEYSGKFALRMSKSTHKQVAERAEEEGISVNQLINQYITMGIGFDYGKQRKQTLLKVNIPKDDFRFAQQIDNLWSERIDEQKINMLQ